MEEYSVIGKRLPRPEGPAKATGSAIFTEDMALPLMLQGKVLRSPFPHARILNIDKTKAERLIGVKAVAAGKDTPGIKFEALEGAPGAAPDKDPLAIEKVRHIGDEVAAVAAVDEDTAEEALDLIKVDYEELPAVFDPLKALEPDAPRIHDFAEKNTILMALWDFGDIERGFKESDHVREDQFLTQFQNHAYLEPQVSLASVDPSGKLTLWASTQNPFQLRTDLSKTLKMPLSMVRVIKPHVGGGFGGKVEMRSSHFCSAFLARRTGRPVKISETREEIFVSALRRHAIRINLKTGVKKDGTLMAVESKYYLEGGAYASVGAIGVFIVGIYMCASYRLPNLRSNGCRVYTNKTPCCPMRGFANPQARFFFESQLDMIALDLGIDPLELRLKNATQSGDTTITGWKIGTCGFSQSIHKVEEMSRFKTWRGKLDKNQGIGFAGHVFISGVNIPPHLATSAAVEFHQDGGVTLLTGASDIGQGMELVLAQIAAEELGVRLEDVRVISPDTEITPFSQGSYSRKGTMYAGNAVKAAAADAKRYLLEAVAKKLEANIEDLEARDRRIYVKGNPEKGMTFSEAVMAAQALKGGEVVIGKGSYNPHLSPPDLLTGKGNISPAYTFGSLVAEVIVDEETGKVDVKKVILASDCGLALNPMSVEGQIDGSVSFGIGQTLMEEFHEERGLTLNPSFLEYKIPLSLDMPDIEAALIEPREPAGPFGAKEAGESAALALPPAIANAINNAFGIRIKELPITPDNVLEAIESKKQG